MKQLIITCNLIFISYFVFGQTKPIILEGKIDKYPIIMQIETYDSNCTIKYFYINQKKDIELEGTFNEMGNILAKTSNAPDENSVESFDLKKTNTGYSGSWILKEKRLAVSLLPTSVGKFKNDHMIYPGIEALKKDDPYNYIKATGFVFTKDSVTLNGVAKIGWFKEKFSGITFPRVLNGYAPNIIEKVNDKLFETHLSESLDYLGCTGSDYYVSTNYIFAHKNVLSVDFSVSYFCGGAHPDFGFIGLNFDTRTGKQLELEDIYWFSKTKPPAKDTDTWYTYRSEVFAPRVVELLTKAYPNEMKKPGDNDEDQCDYSDSDIWDFANWHFTEKGVYLGAYFARAMRSCDSPEWSIIPYKLLKPYLNQESKTVLPE